MALVEKITTGIKKLRHMNSIRSVTWRRLLRVMPQVYLDYRSGQGISHSLVNVTLEATYRCNARCAFCLAGKEAPTSDRRELSASEVGAVAESVAPWGPGFFITGGEPFIRKDMLDIFEAIKRHGLKAGVNTNMSLVDEAMARALNDIGLNYLIASLHGARDIHDKIAGIEIHDRILDNIVCLRRVSPRTRILVNCVVAPESVAHLSDVVEETARAGVHALTLQHETFMTRREVETHERVWRSLFGEETPSPLSVPLRETEHSDGANLARAIAAAQETGRRLGLPVFVKPGLDDAALLAWHEGPFRPAGRCSYLYTDARVTPYGDVVACQSLPLVLGNVREQTLPDIFNNDVATRFRQRIHASGGCIPGCARCCKLYRSF